MSDTMSTAAPPTVARLDAAKLSRSPVVAQLRVNPFRVLRLQADAGVDEAIWKSEELLTLLRAGVPLDEPDALPWLPPPDEQEIRQAVQRTEEPLRRILEQLCWFDFKADPAGELLQSALADLNAAVLNRYLVGAPGTSENVGVRINQVNLRLLLGSLALADALPPSWAEAGLPAKEEPADRRWEGAHSLQVIRNPHEGDLTGGRRAQQLKVAANLWRNALSRWVALLAAPEFIEHVKVCLVQLRDDSVGDEDAETVVNSLTMRLTDLLTGEMKVRILAGRWDLVKALLEVAANCGIEARQMILALRPLRLLFQPAVGDLDVLLGDTTSPRLDDVSHYLERLNALAQEWADLDPTGLLGLDEFIDAAVAKVNGLLTSHQEYGAANQIRKVLQAAAEVARAGSVKQRVLATVGRIDELERWQCHFCRCREAEVNTSAALHGKKETGRTHGFNSTTIHYSLKRNVVPRCPRCAELHQFLLNIGVWAWLACSAFVVVFVLLHAEALFGRNFNPVVLGGLGVVCLLSGFAFRWGTAACVTPEGERWYRSVSSARQYKELRAEGYGITLDCSRNAFQKVIEESKRR